MTQNEALEVLLKSYHDYYDVTRIEDPDSLFAAQAVFHSHDEQFFLVKKAVVSEAESNEIVSIAVCDALDADFLRKLDETAWNDGIAHVKPHRSHRNTDITLIILADTVSAEAKQTVKKLRRYQSYKLGMCGWSNYRLVALECSTGTLSCNRMGKELKKLFRNIVK